MNRIPVLYEYRDEVWWYSEDFGRSWRKGARL